MMTKVSGTHLQGLLRFIAEEGKIFMGGSRILLMRADAMGALRKALIDTVGLKHARNILTRFGYVCGQEDALTLRKRMKFKDDEEWLLAGPLIHTQIGHVFVEPVEFRLNKKKKQFLVRARWRNSYEAEQHKRFFGHADEPTCWSLAGYASGWSSAVMGEKALCLEAECEGKGDPHCSLEIRRAAEWGDRAKERISDLEEIKHHGARSFLEDAEKQLQAQEETSERQFRQLSTLYQAFRRSNDVVFYTDPEGIILDVNEAFTRTYGFTPAEAIGQTPRILRSPQSAREVYERMWKSILDPNKGHWRGELINRTKDGRDIPVLLTITTVHDEAGETVGYVSNAVDLSQQRDLQARVAQSEALANLGEMAAVVAHEIRNPLGSIVMAAKQLTGNALTPDDRDMVLKVLKDESQRLNGVLSTFLAYARPRKIKLGTSDLNELVREVSRMVRSNADLIKNIGIQLSLAPDLEPFPMDADQIRQVIWNIVLNGVQAMGGMGTLTITTGHGEEHAYVRVRDTGPGIAETSMRDIFKPFHTTKRQGTGLGLAIAERIVKSHGGSLSLESEPGKGAAFTVRLPAVQD